MSRENRTTAYQEGRQASADGLEYWENPHPIDSEEFKDWDDGWVFNDCSSSY